MNYPAVIEYSYSEDKFRAEYTFDEFYDVYVWSENESVGPFLKDQEIELGWWIMYYHHSYEGIMEMINEQEKTMQQNTIKQMEQTVEQLLAKAEELKQQIEKAKEQEDVWPKDGDKYWYAGGNGTVYQGCWENTVEDNNRLRFNNVHRSRAEGEAHVDKRLTQSELERLAAKAWKESGKQIDWSKYSEQKKFHIGYCYDNESFFVDSNWSAKFIGQVFFPTEESAMNAIETISEERLKKLLM